MNHKEELLIKIAIKKRELVKIAMDKGIGSKETIKCSQELDEMINSFYKCQKVLCTAGSR